MKEADSFHKHCVEYYPLLDASDIRQTISNDTSIIESTVFISRRDSVVGIAIGYRPDDQGVGARVPVWSRIFSTSSRLALGPTQPPTQWIPGTLSPGDKAAEA
jgi:hypothetical protein